jgi:enoyl-CoA hydratase
VDDYQDILYEVADGRARITLNRPEKHNAISAQMQQELHDALWAADDDRRVHCVIIRGAGRSFSAGYDLNAPPGARDRSEHSRGFRTFDDDAWNMERGQRLLMALFDMHKPTVAQVHGYCLAGATGIAGLCDLVIAADDAVFGFPPARDLGALPTNMWLYHVGPQWTKRLTMSGDTITGAEAAEIGLVLKSVPADLLEAEVEQLCDRFALIDADLLTANKRIVNLGMELMGARTLQRLAVENDARGHLAASAAEFRRRASEGGLREALRQRDEAFGDGRARVKGPERRDEHGRLVD